MTAVARWHTDPQISSDDTEEIEPTKLSDLININSSDPLYKLIVSHLASVKAGSDNAWLQSILDSFDLHVTRVLHTLHVAPWDRDYAIRQEYMHVYGVTSVSPEWNIRAVMARLLTYREVVDYCERAASPPASAGGASGGGGRSKPCSSPLSFLFQTPGFAGGLERPLWSVDCVSGGHRNPQQKPARLMTGLNPSNPRLAYFVTHERPWLSSSRVARLDPTHHWGVYIDRDTDHYTNALGLSSDAPVRMLMACCAEPVGRTEGCWMTLADDKGGVEGIVKPYVLFPTVFNGAWERMALSSSPPPLAAAIRDDYVVGTAFKDYARYDALHKRIQTSWAVASDAIAAAYIKYVADLQATADRYEGDANRETNPYERILTDAERDQIALPIRLQHEFNEIQCLGYMDPPVMRDYVNQRVFRVYDMLTHFTYVRVGGLEVTTLSGGKDRLPMLSTDRPDPVKADALIQKIKTAKKDVNLDAISAQAEAVQKSIGELKAQEAMRAELERLNVLYTKEAPTAVIPSTLDWVKVQRYLGVMTAIEESIVRKQVSINESMRSMRPKATFTAVSKTRIAQAPDLNAEDVGGLKEFERNMGVIILTNAIKSGSIVARSTVPDFSKPPALLKNLYDKASTEEARSDPTDTRPKERPSNGEVESNLVAAKTAYDNVVTASKASRNDEITTIRNIKQQLAAVNDYDSDDKVKLAVVASLKVEDVLDQVELAAKKRIQDLVNAAKAYDTAVVAANQAHQAKIIAEQQRKAAELAAAKLAVKTAAGKAKVVTVTTSTADPKTETTNSVIKPLLEAMALLPLVDPSNQLYLQYSKALRDIESLIPTKAEIDAIPKARAPLMAALNSSDSILQAAARLATALGLLADNLGDVSKKETVDNIFSKALAAAVEARRTVETDADRIERLRREAEEKRRQEAAAQQRLQFEINKTAVQVDSSTRLNFFEWLDIQDRSRLFQYSLTVLTKFDEYIINKQSNDLPFAAFYTGLKDDNVFAASKFFILKTGDPNRPEKLIGRWEDNATFKKSPNGEYNSLYLEGMGSVDFQRLKDLYRAFALALVSYGMSEHDGHLKDFIQRYIYHDTLLPEQPIAWQHDFTNKANVADVSSLSQRFPAIPMYNTNNMISESYLRWNNESCWMDSSYVTLFSIPQTTLVNHIHNTQRLVVPAVTLVFSSGRTVSIQDNDSSRCTPTKIAALHEHILEDIRDIQNPSAGQKAICQSKAMWARDYGCVKSPALGAEETPDMVFESLIPLYGLDNILSFEYNPKLRQTVAEATVDVPASTRTSIYVQGLPVKASWDGTYKNTRDQFQKLGVARWVVPQNSNRYQLGGVICYSGRHYNAYVYDFARKGWIFVDNLANKSEWVGVLPADLYDFSRGFAVSHVVYFSDVEVTMLLQKHIAAKAKITPPITIVPPIPSATTTLPFSDKSAAFPFGDESELGALFVMTKSATNPSWMTPEWRSAALLDKEWTEVRTRVLALDRVCLEGLLHAWYAVREQPVDAAQRFVVGITRADMDMDSPPKDTDVTPPPTPGPLVTPAPAAPGSQTPPPSPGPGQPPAPAAPGVATLDLFGDRLFAKPTNMTDLKNAFDDMQQLVGNRPELGLGVNFDSAAMQPVFNDAYRLTGLMHAWWGAQPSTANQEAQVRGASMADL